MAAKSRVHSTNDQRFYFPRSRTRSGSIRVSNRARRTPPHRSDERAAARPFNESPALLLPAFQNKKRVDTGIEPRQKNPSAPF